MPSLIGTQLGSYEVLSLLGRGGMGEVYRARDRKLKREVAIKTLPEEFSRDPERLARFQREAEALAALNHPNIAHVYGLEESANTRCIVMELVEGDTLQQRLTRGAIPVEEALMIAKQIAEALESAHERGIIHRDLKPGNVMLTADGKVKVLDFGLAKALQEQQATNLSNSPTMMTAASRPGVILGTVSYMSPEQARGKAVDKRADIWALGCVIYEALTGKQAFGGDDVSDTIAAVIRDDPDWSILPAGTPRRLRDLLRRCLEKDPRHRLRDAADVRIALEDAERPEVEIAEFPPRSATYPVAALALALFAGVAIASVLWWMLGRSAKQTVHPMHLSVELVSGTLSSFTGNYPAISPDGNWIVYSASHNGAREQLLLRGIQESEVHWIDGTDGAVRPFFSPDGQWIGFESGKTLKKVPRTGGAPTTVADLSTTDFHGASWDHRGNIVFVPDYNAGVWTVPSGGGTPQLLLKTDLEKNLTAYNAPQVLPGERGILLTIVPADARTLDDYDIGVLEPGRTTPRILIHGGGFPQYVSTGHLIYVHSGALLSVSFDLAQLAVRNSCLCN
jgi:serine/threonine protein kinase